MSVDTVKQLKKQFALTKEQMEANAAANFIYARKQLKLSQQKFADALEVKRPVIGAIEEYRSLPTPHMIYKLSVLINVSISTLYINLLDDSTDNA